MAIYDCFQYFNEDHIVDLRFNILDEYVDYFVINISSPNTPRLRELQTPNFLRDLFKDLNIERAKRKKYKPILIKISPDLEKNKIDELLQIIKHCKIDGIVATNTTDLQCWDTQGVLIENKIKKNNLIRVLIFF